MNRASWLDKLYYFLPIAPAQDAAAIVPNDATVLDPPARALWVGTAGNLTVVTRLGTEVTFSNVPAGTLIEVSVSKVKSTSTTAGSIVGMY